MTFIAIPPGAGPRGTGLAFFCPPVAPIRRTTTAIGSPLRSLCRRDHDPCRVAAARCRRGIVLPAHGRLGPPPAQAPPRLGRRGRPRPPRRRPASATAAAPPAQAPPHLGHRPPRPAPPRPVARPTPRRAFSRRPASPGSARWPRLVLSRPRRLTRGSSGAGPRSHPPVGW